MLKNIKFRSQENLLHLVNVYYGHNVVGKQKNMNIKRESKAPGIPSLAPYKNVAKIIGQFILAL